MTRRAHGHLKACFGMIVLVAASALLAGDSSWVDEQSGLVLTQRLPDGWAILEAERHPSTENLVPGEYAFFADDPIGGEFVRRVTVYRYDRWDEQTQPLATVDDAALEMYGSFANLTFSAASCGPIALGVTGISNDDMRAIARAVACDESGLHLRAPLGMKRQCVSHYRDERLAVLIVGSATGVTAVFHIFDNACPLAMYLGQPSVIAGRDVLFDEDFDGGRVDCVLRIGGSIVWGQHLGSDKATARADLELLVAGMRSATTNEFDHSVTR